MQFSAAYARYGQMALLPWLYNQSGELSQPAQIAGGGGGYSYKVGI
jgi:hypothetical protein